MSWAARRKATRKEDEAYSLLGIFNVNMPLLYGEGSRAFRRLQEEIARESVDESLFAWCYQPSQDPGHRFPLLADEPRTFDQARGVTKGFARSSNIGSPRGKHRHFELTPVGLFIQGLCYQAPTEDGIPRLHLPLRCHVVTNSDARFVAVLTLGRNIDEVREPSQQTYVRDRLLFCPEEDVRPHLEADARMENLHISHDFWIMPDGSAFRLG
jgi:hypothetical protein